MTGDPFAIAPMKLNTVVLENIFFSTGENFIFEVELDKPDPAMDFSVCILKSKVPSLLNLWQNKVMKKALINNEIWQKIINYCSVWSKPGSPLDDYVTEVWFEFDNNQLSKTLPEPCFFFSTGKLEKSLQHGKDIHRKSNLIRLIDTALESLNSGRMTDRKNEKIRECILALPPNGTAFQVGVFLARGTDSVRICTAMPVNEYPEFLKKIKWPGSFQYLEPALQTFHQYVDCICLDIDVEEDVFAKIGIECSFKKKKETRAKLLKFTDLLIELQLCSGKNAKAMIDWLGLGDRQETFWGKEGLERGLSHIKIILDKDNTAAAKTYLSLAG
jgi:hypothetical protein